MNSSLWTLVLILHGGGDETRESGERIYQKVLSRACMRAKYTLSKLGNPAKLSSRIKETYCLTY